MNVTLYIRDDDKAVWQAFRKLAKRKGTSLSQEVTETIRICLLGVDRQTPSDFPAIPPLAQKVKDFISGKIQT